MKTADSSRALVLYDDPQMLLLLLCNFLKVADQNHGEIPLSEIGQAAKDLGYSGSLPPLCRNLVAQGFISKYADGSYRIEEYNRAAIRQFNLEFEYLSTPLRFSEQERQALFATVSSHGSDVEKSALRVTRLLSELLRELFLCTRLEKSVQLAVAESTAALLIDTERNNWYIDRTHQAVERAHSFGNAAGVGSLALAFVALQEAAAWHARSLEAFERVKQHDKTLGSLAHDQRVVSILNQTRKHFYRLVTALIEAEEK